MNESSIVSFEMFNLSHVSPKSIQVNACEKRETLA